MLHILQANEAEFYSNQTKTIIKGSKDIADTEQQYETALVKTKVAFHKNKTA